MRRAFVLPILAVFAGAAPSADTPIKTGVEEHVEVQLVQLNFIATDGKGNPVPGLTTDDVEITEGGAPRRLAFVQPYYERRGTAQKAPAPAGPSASVAVSPGRWIVFVVDNYASSQGTKLRAVQALQQFVTKDMAPGDRAAIVAFTGKTELVQTFTSDREKLKIAADRVFSTIDRVAADRFGEIASLLDLMQTCRGSARSSSCAQSQANAYEDERAREADAFLVALTQLTRSLAPIPDVKAIVLFSDGFARIPASDAIDAARATLGFRQAMQLNFSVDRTDAAFDTLADAASRARVSFFTINPGSTNRAGVSSAQVGSAQSEATNPEQIDVFRRSQENYQQGLAELARRTGGTASLDPDVHEALGKIIDLSAGLYTAGYYLSDDRKLFGNHDVRIKIRRKGVHVDVRREIPHLPDPPLLTGELTAVPDPCSENKRRIVVARLRLDRSRLVFEKVGKIFSNNFSIYLRVQEDDRAEPLHDSYRYLNITNTAEEMKQGRLPDPVIEETLQGPCRPLTVLVTAIDSGTGSRAEFTARVEP
jgi:VWFA-related protein